MTADSPNQSASPEDSARPPRPKKRDVHGWVVLDKPVGMTSTHAVSVVKRAFSAKKAGHAGTLDPLASGLLSGRYDEDTSFAEDDHRHYNRDGSAFDVGETFAGVDYETGVAAAREFTALVREHGPEGATPAQVALAWCAQQDGVSTVIPGARSADQARANAAAGELPALSSALLDGVRALYDSRLREQVHNRW